MSEIPYPSRLDLSFLNNFKTVQKGQEPTHHVKVAQNLGRLTKVQKELVYLTYGAF